MRSLKSGLVAIVLAGVFGCAAVAGCSADGGGTGITEDQQPTEPGASLPPPSMGGDGTDASKPNPPKSDGGTKTDSGADAGPPPPNPGDACMTLNAKTAKKCGKCGTAEAICIDDGSGKGKWSDYGQCEAEQGDCTPGATQDCGNCGKQTCTNYCVWGACTGEPANSCSPGAVENTTAGCATPGTYRNRTCGATCSWGGYSATCAEPINGNKLTASSASGGVASFNGSLSTANLTKRPTGSSCPASGVSTTANLAYDVVEVSNPTGQTLNVQVYHTGATRLDTLMWIYKKTLAPKTDAELQACDFGVADSCIAGDPCGNGAGNSLDWAGIDNVSIPPNGKILVYSSGYSASVNGPYTLNVKTK